MKSMSGGKFLAGDAGEQEPDVADPKEGGEGEGEAGFLGISAEDAAVLAKLVPVDGSFDMRPPVLIALSIASGSTELALRAGGLQKSDKMVKDATQLMHTQKSTQAGLAPPDTNQGLPSGPLPAEGAGGPMEGPPAGPPGPPMGGPQGPPQPGF